MNFVAPPFRRYSADDLCAPLVVACENTDAARATNRDAVGKQIRDSSWCVLGDNAKSGLFILGELLNECKTESELRLSYAVGR